MHIEQLNRYFLFSKSIIWKENSVSSNAQKNYGFLLVPFAVPFSFISLTFAAMALCLSESFFLLVAVFVEGVVIVDTRFFNASIVAFVSCVITPENLQKEKME